MSRIPADVYGDPDPRAVVLLHGAVVNRAMWRGIGERVSPAWPVLAPDLPGHGELTHRPFTMAAAVRTVGAVLDEHGVREAVLAGESLGGYVALAAALKLRQRVSGVVLSGASVDPDGRAGTLFAFYASLSGLMVRCLGRRRLERWTEVALRRSFPRAPIAPITELGLQVGSRAHALRALSGYDLFAGIDRLTAHILILNGSRDVVNRIGARSLSKHSPSVERRRIRGVGHGVALSQPEVFADELILYLERRHGA